jgi:lysophospholipase L1-like esterase
MKPVIALLALLIGAFPLWAQTQTTPAISATPPPAQTVFALNLEKTAPGVGPINGKWAGFQKVWDGQRAKFAKATQADMGAVVFFGDSITEHWDTAKAFPSLKTANRGIAGDTTRGMLYRLQEDVIDLQPRLIVYLGGINDLSMPEYGGTPEVIAANVKSILTALQAKLPQTPVIVCEIMPGKSSQIIAANAAVDEVLLGFPNAHRLKIYSLFLNPDGKQNASLFKDGTHPNDTGYAIWQSALEPEINKWSGNHASPASSN